MAMTSPAQTFKTLVNFDGTNGGFSYLGPLVQGRDGNFYGTTSIGGTHDMGTIFKMTPKGKLTTLYAFCAQANCADGANPVAGLLLGTDGNFYGTTAGGGEPGCDDDGGCGTVFKITPAGALKTLHTFCVQKGCADGSNPFARLIQASDGNFYGTTEGGGANRFGTVFRITSEGHLTILYSFCARYGCTDGYAPMGAVVQATDGNLYGTTPYGGDDVYDGGYGTIFRITLAGKLTTIYNFCDNTCSDGAYPFDGPIRGADGNLYGTTAGGGNAEGEGTVFRLTESGVLTTLYTFCSQTGCADGTGPYSAPIEGTDGNLYGETYQGGDSACNPPFGCGTLYKVTPAGAFTTLHRFDSTDGSNGFGMLVQGTVGNFYGTTGNGGVGGDSCSLPYGCGTVFGLHVGLAPFVAFVRDSGKVGQTGGILGQGFTGTTSVSLNGTPASFTVVSDTFIRATVPAGATSGYVTVTTPSGTLTSNVPFYVIP